MSSTALTESSVVTFTESPYRRSLKVAVCALTQDAGFAAADDASLETLTEMLQSLITELARSSKAFAELGGRTQPLVADIVVALVEMGLNVDSIPVYGRRISKLHVMPPQKSVPSTDTRRLQVGTKRPHPSHIPDYMPAFPDPHTYIRSVTYRPPVSEYKVVREKASAEHRDIERALTRFIAKTGDTENLFPDDPYAFPLIANKLKPLPYLEALLQKDEDAESEELEGDEKRLKQQQQQQTESHKSDLMQTSLPSGSIQQKPAELSASYDTFDSDSMIDNPYLRPIVMPKLKVGSRKSR